MTLSVSLPSNSRSKPCQPCGAITTRSQACCCAAVTIALAGADQPLCRPPPAAAARCRMVSRIGWRTLGLDPGLSTFDPLAYISPTIGVPAHLGGSPRFLRETHVHAGVRDDTPRLFDLHAGSFPRTFTASIEAPEGWPDASTRRAPAGHACQGPDVAGIKKTRNPPRN